MSTLLGRDVVLDACVLVPLHLRNLLFTAAEAGLYRVRWSDMLLEEVRRTLKENLKHATDEQIDHLFREMNAYFPGARITGFESLIGQMDNADEDRHVLAAALSIGAARIVTDNLRDFRSALLDDHDLSVVSPDEFLTEPKGQAPHQMVAVLQTQVSSYVRRPISLAELLDRLSTPAPTFVAEVRQWLARMPATE